MEAQGRIRAGDPCSRAKLQDQSRNFGPSRLETVEIPAIGFQAHGFDMNRMTEGGRGVNLATLDDRFESAVCGEFPVDCYRCIRHSSAGLKRLWGEPSPKNNALMIGITRDHAAGERLTGKAVSWGGRSALPR